MPNAVMNYSPQGWPYLDEDNYLTLIPTYTQEIGVKLDNADADVAAAVNAAAAAQAAAAAVAGDARQTFTTGFAGGFSGTVTVKRTGGGVIEVTGDLAGSIPTGTLTVAAGRIPAALRPGSAGGNAQMACYLSAGYPGVVYITPAGDIGIANQSGATRTFARFRGTYVVDA